MCSKTYTFCFILIIGNCPIHTSYHFQEILGSHINYIEYDNVELSIGLYSYYASFTSYFDTDFLFQTKWNCFEFNSLAI